MRKIDKVGATDDFKTFKRNNPGSNWISDFSNPRCDAYLIYCDCRYIMLTDEQVFQCGYTEKYIEGTKDCHIDHYVKRSLDAVGAAKTFDWDNLIVATNDEDFGAKYKDNKYKIKLLDYPLIFNPVTDSPEQYFSYMTNGEIVPKSDITDNSIKEKVLKTVEVFNLNDTSLARQRADLMIQIRTCITQFEQTDLFKIFEESGFKSVLEQCWKDYEDGVL